MSKLQKIWPQKNSLRDEDAGFTPLWMNTYREIEIPTLLNKVKVYFEWNSLSFVG
jgi:hypothetical protein